MRERQRDKHSMQRLSDLDIVWNGVVGGGACMLKDV